MWVKALVDTTGQVFKALVTESSGCEPLDEAALKAAYMNKFKRALQGEKPIPVGVSYKIYFELNDDAGKKEKGDG